MNPEIEINTQIDWERPLGLVKFYDSWKFYRDVDYSPYLHLIVEVKEIKPRSDGGFEMIDFAWTVIPIFHRDGYVVNGHFQMPLFKGNFPAEKLLMELRRNTPWEYIQQILKDKKGYIKPQGKTSILFRLLDVQLEVSFLLIF